MNVIVIGGGAAGLMAAVSVKEHHPHAQVTVLEQSTKFLAKVKVSGGGRCNVMHTPLQLNNLLKKYPRGQKILKKTLPLFGPEQTLKWFEQRGVQLKTEEDGRMFPISDRSQTIMDCLLNTARTAGVSLQKKSHVQHLEQITDQTWMVTTKEDKLVADKVIIAAGGSPNRTGFEWLENMGHEIIGPVPSIFTFNIPDKSLNDLQGITVPEAMVRIQGLKGKETGPMLITHWGFSGPPVLRLSAFSAFELAEKNYHFEIAVNWIAQQDQEKVKSIISEELTVHPNRNSGNNNIPGIPQRLWSYLLNRAGINPLKPNNEIGSKMLNRLVETICNDQYKVEGRTTFKEEFVTAGGVSESSVKLPSLESAHCSGVYFCGEVLNMDGITGGFNFQAAWSTGYVAGMLL